MQLGIAEKVEAGLRISFLKSGKPALNFHKIQLSVVKKIELKGFQLKE